MAIANANYNTVRNNFLIEAFSNDGAGEALKFQKSRAGSTIVSGDSLSAVYFQGWEGTSFISGAQIVSTSSGTIAAGRVAGNLVFQTHPDSVSAPLTRLTINPTGTIVIAAPDSGTALTISSGGANITGNLTLSGMTTDGTLYYDGTKVTSTAVGTANFVLTSNGAGLAPTYQAVSASGAVIAVNGTTNQITSSGTTTVTLSIPSVFIAPGTIASTTTNTAGTDFISTAGNLKLPTTSSTVGQIQINASRVLHTFGTSNTFVGKTSGNFTLTGGSAQFNTSLGESSLITLTTGNRNTCIGYQAGTLIADGAHNTLVGLNGGQFITSGSNNSFYGSNNAGGSVSTGSNNTCMGYGAGSSLTTSDSSNIVIGSVAATAGDNNKIIIGTSGSSAGQQNKAYIAGIYGVTPGVASPRTVIIDSNGQLGSTTAISSTTFNGDSGSATGATITLAGTTNEIRTTASGSTVTFDLPNIFMDADDVYVGVGAGNVANPGFNTFIGQNAGNACAAGQGNVAVGYQAYDVGNQNNNTLIGNSAGGALTSGANNTALGQGALQTTTTGSRNIALGSVITGTDYPGKGWGTGVSDNICIANLGQAADAGIIRIGTSSVHTAMFLAGAVTGSSSITATTTVTAGTDFISTAGNLKLPTTSSTVGQIQINSNRVLHAYGTNNIYLGTTAGNFTTTGTDNVAIGLNALVSGTSNDQTVAIGSTAADALTSADGVTAIGYNALGALTQGNHNTAVGANAGSGITTGLRNVFIGYNCGTSLTGSDTDNILIGDGLIGTAGDNNKLKIGLDTGTGTSQINECRICGITGITVTGTAVLVSTSNQLGIAVSSERYKDNINPMYDYSNFIYKLKPVTFTYKSYEDQQLQSGLIAEQVADVNPNLVVYDKQGLPQSVKYHDLPVLLLNELQKAVRQIEYLQAQVAWLTDQITEKDR